MSNGPPIALIASLIGDPARANMLLALMGGKALTASELANEAGVTPQTASGHLARLLDGGLVFCVQQGRHRYFRLASPEIADLLESLMGIAVRSVRPKTRTGPRDQALRRARVCYDHLAGEEGVNLTDGLLSSGSLAVRDGSFVLTGAGRRFLCDFGIDIAALEQQRRPLCRACLDWSERRSHLGGAVGASLLSRFEALGWMRRVAGSRVMQVTPNGQLGLRRLLAEAGPRERSDVA
jgi:DNA-binding transcriptional ArsR family regulator